VSFCSPGQRGAPQLVGQSAAIVRVLDLLDRAAIQRGSVLITAEAGTSAIAVAEELHRRGDWSSGPFLAIDCASGDAARVERTLSGAAPPDAAAELEWASADRAITAACGGTLFLQDVTALPANAK
jgi:DNA-binding NtrC family response regulator